jgi:hypothetical protein
MIRHWLAFFILQLKHFPASSDFISIRSTTVLLFRAWDLQSGVSHEKSWLATFPSGPWFLTIHS